MNIPFVKYRKISFVISGSLILASIISLSLFGLNFGKDFTGGSLLEIEFEKARPQISEIHQGLSSFGFKGITVQAVGEKGIIILSLAPLLIILATIQLLIYSRKI